jgi:hypothetical protein
MFWRIRLQKGKGKEKGTDEIRGRRWQEGGADDRDELCLLSLPHVVLSSIRGARGPTTTTSGWSRKGQAAATSGQNKKLLAAEKHLSTNKQGRMASADHDPEENGGGWIKKKMINLQPNRDARDAQKITRERREQRPQSHYPFVKHMPFAAASHHQKSTTIAASWRILALSEVDDWRCYI